MNFPDDKTIFLDNSNFFPRTKRILKVYEKTSNSKMIFSKNWASRARRCKYRTDKLGKMIWSQSLTKIPWIHFGNYILYNNELNKINQGSVATQGRTMAGTKEKFLILEGLDRWEMYSWACGLPPYIYADIVGWSHSFEIWINRLTYLCRFTEPNHPNWQIKNMDI